MSFNRLDPQDFVVSADAVSSAAWSSNIPTLTTFFTSSAQETGQSGEFYLNVLNTGSDQPNSEIQFAIAYCDSTGGGASSYNPTVNNYSPSTTMYGSYRTLVLEDENSSFTFGDGTNLITGSDFWVLSVERARYKEKLFPGTFNLTLTNGSDTIQLTDNSNVTKVQTFLGSNRVLQIVSGSNGTPYNTTGYVTDSGSYGLFLPDIGTILLNPDAISQSINVVPTRTADLPNGTNQAILYNSIVEGASFTLNAKETITSDYVFVRSRNAEFNYSENPSFISGSTGEVIYTQFINNPQVYITTVGMYNDANELVAVAKLSKPLLKDFTKESLIRVKLDF